MRGKKHHKPTTTTDSTQQQQQCDLATAAVTATASDNSTEQHTAPLTESKKAA
jgi:hypothetical protein